jgi:ring-1,2-phenylacetyl-CoA epoxidase subunit PaaD
MTKATTVAHVRELLDAVTDPEIPVLTIAGLGILRTVELSGDGSVVVTITPTYSGCPAMRVIVEDIKSALHGAGLDRVEVRTVFTPAWTTDWMTDDAKEKIAAFGIAPPGAVGSIPKTILCPQCASTETKTVSEFGSTACKALMVCNECLEPFDYFKAI